MASQTDRVVPLSKVGDQQVAQDDVRGWTVVAGDGRRLGQVAELLVDPRAMTVRYLDVGVDPELLAGDRHVLIPVRYTRLQRESSRVVVDDLRPEQLRDLSARPATEPEPVVPEPRAWGRPRLEATSRRHAAGGT